MSDNYSPEDAVELEVLKESSMLQKLFKAARQLDELAVARLREEADLPNLRPAHTSLFPHIELEGSRSTEIAEKLGVSKQAVAQLVNELVEMNVLHKVPDPSDGRAKLIRFSKQPGRSLFDGLAALSSLETELAHEIGEGEIQAFSRTLSRLLGWLEDRGLN